MPSEILKRRGSRRADRLPGGTRKVKKPKAVSRPPRCPAFLNAEGKATWKRLCQVLKEMGLLSDSYRELMAGMCQQWSRYVRLSRMLNTPLATEMMPDAASKIDRQANDALRLFMQISDRFGLSPAELARVAIVDSPPKKDEEREAKLRLIRPKFRQEDAAG